MLPARNGFACFPCRQSGDAMISIPVLLLLQAASAPATPPPRPWEPRTRTVAGGVTSTIAQVSGKDGSRLVVKCDRGTEALVSVQFFAGQPLSEADASGAFASKPVGVRFDGGAANEYDWQFRAAAAFISDEAAVTSLTQQLAHAKQIKVETTNAANFRVEAVFDGPPSEAPIRQVLAACSTTPAPQATATPAPAAKPAPRKARRK